MVEKYAASLDEKGEIRIAKVTRRGPWAASITWTINPVCKGITQERGCAIIMVGSKSFCESEHQRITHDRKSGHCVCRERFGRGQLNPKSIYLPPILPESVAYMWAGGQSRTSYIPNDIPLAHRSAILHSRCNPGHVEVSRGIGIIVSDFDVTPVAATVGGVRHDAVRGRLNRGTRRCGKISTKVRLIASLNWMKAP